MHPPRSLWQRALRATGALFLALLSTYFGLCTACLLAYRELDPPATGVQVQRRVEAFLNEEPHTRRYAPLPRARMSDHLEHAVVAAEDARFYTHHGIDWTAIREAVEDNLQRGRLWRGGSSITQQLVKNLFMTTHSTFLRKGLEVPLAYLAELLLPKQRILELYLNVVEWGPNVYGAEAAARYHYGTSATHLSRYRAAALAACLPDPRVRTPARMHGYTGIILARMRRRGW